MPGTPPARVCLDLTPLEMRDRHGGIGRYALHLATRLSALPAEALEGIELYGLYSSARPPLPVRRAIEECENLGPELRSRLHRLRRRWVSGRMLRGADIQLFHSVDAAVLPRRPGCPIISTSHDVIPLVLPERRGALDQWHRARKRARLGRSYRRAALIVADSETTRRDVVRELAIPESRISVVYLGVDSEHFTPQQDSGEGARLRRELELPERWFLCVSSDHRRKNHQRLFEAWHRVSDRIPEGLVFVGKAMYEQTLQELRREAERRGILSRFRWLDGIDDATLPALYRQATATIAPSLYEGFGMTLLEAMACGSPVAAAANGAYEEVGGDAVLCFAPREPAAIEQALLRLSGEPALRSQLRDRGLQRARAWSWDRTARSTLALYRRVLGERAGHAAR